MSAELGPLEVIGHRNNIEHERSTFTLFCLQPGVEEVNTKTPKVNHFRIEGTKEEVAEIACQMANQHNQVYAKLISSEDGNNDNPIIWIYTLDNEKRCNPIGEYSLTTV